MAKYNVDSGSSAHVFQLLMEVGTDENRKLVYYGSNAQSVFQQAVECIDRHLDAGRPIMVGVNHTLYDGKKAKINEGATDHFVIITGRGYDTAKGQYYYTYMDTGTAYPDKGCNTRANRFYYTPGATPSLIDDPGINGKKYTVTQVRPNDGNYSGTTVQPTKQ